ncbi:DUF4129 domain-containing protein [Oscillatoria sp. FACHB-1407]|uniref:DUF4129 domain-containing protein n=1 Tax=Oscillatoria sp. FACHB-1407 TaxID=2692847 RepID=UPI001686B0A2|nr:DUF4129 domain-containing protein [Oscillatoria sp. FACHB-1407]
MSAGSFDKNSISWQFQQMGRWVQEWFELQFSNTPDLPTGAAPNWPLETIFWIVTIAIVAWLSWYLVLFMQALLQNLNASQPWVESQRTKPKDNLPVSGWLRQAQAFQRQGNYAQACRALYMAMLQRLDDTKQVPQQASRTDGEYLQAVQTLSQPTPYQVLISTHEQVCFDDNTAISSATFERCQQAYREIETQ